MRENLAKFEKTVRQLIEFYQDKVEAADMCEVFERLAGELEEIPGDGAYMLESMDRLVGVFFTPNALERELANLLEVQAICVPLEDPPPMMTEIDVVVRTDWSDELSLPGRVVHVSGDQVAIQTFINDHSVVEKLRALPEHMRTGAPPKARTTSDITKPALPRIPPNTPPAVAVEAQPELPPQQEVRRDIKQSGSFRRVEVTEIDPRAELEPEVIQLENHNVLPVLVRLAQERFNGMIELFGAAREKLVITLREGCLIEFEREPEREEDKLEVLLSNAGKISTEDIARASERAESLGTSVADALLDLRLMEYGDLRVALKTRLIFMARKLWSGEWQKAEVYQFDTSLMRTLTPPVPIYQQLFSVTLEQYESNINATRLETIKKRFERVMLKMNEDSALDINELGLSTKQRRFVEVGLAEKRQIADLLLVSPMGQSDSLAMLAALDDIGLLEKDRVTEWTKQRTRQRNQLELMMLKIEREDHFDVLGLHWSAYGDEVEQAYQNAVKDYSEDNFDALEVGPDLQKIRARLEQAYQHLKDGPSRRRYRREQISEFKIRSSIDMFRKQAESAQMRRELESAIDFNRRVLELSPGDQQSQRALELLKKAMALRDQGALR
jgi:hypothetical protein